MTDSTRSIRSKLPELLLEAVMVVFAVVVALGVEEWRDEREMQDFADRAREAVIAEISANLDEFYLTGPALDSTAAVLVQVLREDDISPMEGDLSLTLPEFSSAAWRTAQSSRAAQYLDYDWMIQVSRAYEVHEYYLTIANQLIEGMSQIVGRQPSVEKVDVIFGRLLILNGIHGEVEERLELLLEPEA